MRIILLGPTASGKTELSLLLAETLNTSIISADSRQCYKYMNIGTAKPTPSELSRVQHFNIDLLELDQDDSAIEFQNRAAAWEQNILRNNAFVIYAGGSTLHLQSLIQPFDIVPDSDENNIAAMEEEIKNTGLESLYNRLKLVDPDYISKMDGMNRQRIIRALDVYMQTGKPFSSFHSNEDISPDDQTLVYGIQHMREVLYDRINDRVDHMIENGLVQEVEAILDMGYSPDLQSLNTVGYSEIIKFLQGEWSLEMASEKIKTHTRRYAKRQITWFKRWNFINWLDANGKKSSELQEILLSDLAAKAKKG
ncbi:tRNA (adenosine(37)-N6)-dimethylallyltransferase MiaA [Balneola sp. MJW-20]|uniref:tRNA (adenosine(37)-N6)-dimethylallyltransferase MiaA n=1 Tax=Gracilimonas aurantiaca TaxID=3234185 RepID=UPI0034657D98